MRRAIINRTFTTICGKTLTINQVEGENAKLHSTEGPALIYPESEGLPPEYYIYGIKYGKLEWQSLVNQYKNITPLDLPSEY